MPATGKSLVGQHLAKKLGMPVWDTDEKIQAEQNKSIYEIFAEYGEAHFRQLEYQLLSKLPKQPCVVITGGGLPCNEISINILLSLGTIIYIKTSIDTLKNRILLSDQRPMFLGLNKTKIKAKLSELLDARRSYYEQAHIQVRNKDNVELLVEEIVQKINLESTTSNEYNS